MQVSVVVPAMNRADLIGRALDSVRRQTHAPVEVLVIDDASEDDTAEVARAHGATVLTLSPRCGSGPARNAGIERAAGTWVAFLDSDDEWDPDHLATVLTAAQQHVLVTSPARTSSGRLMGNTAGRELALTPRELLVPGNVVVTSGTIVRRDVLLDIGGFRRLQGAEDLDVWLQALERGSGRALARPTLTYYEHGSQSSGDRDRTRQAFQRILTSCEDRVWFTPAVRVQSSAWMVWDDLRSAQRSGDWTAAGRHAFWFARHPVAVPTLLQVLGQRRRSRALRGR